MEIHDPELLAEIDILFAPDGVFDVEGDAGWNCYAKAFIAMWLLRLWGEDSYSYQGGLCVVDVTATGKEIRKVYPHAWAGLSEKHIVDISIRDVGGLPNLTVFGSRVAEAPAWSVYVEKDPTKYDRIASGCISHTERKFLVYRPERVCAFSADGINDVRATLSPSVSRTLLRHSENLLPKAVLHVFLFAEGKVDSFREVHIASPWDQLQGWEVDARGELSLLLKRNF